MGFVLVLHRVCDDMALQTAVFDDRRQRCRVGSDTRGTDMRVIGDEAVAPRQLIITARLGVITLKNISSRRSGKCCRVRGANITPQGTVEHTVQQGGTLRVDLPGQKHYVMISRN